MAIGLVGKKQGMTRLFTQEGNSYPVSVVTVKPNTVTQVKTLEKDADIIESAMAKILKQKIKSEQSKT